MKINPADLPLELVETNIIEALKTGSGNGPNPVIRHQEMFLPSHKDVLSLCYIRNSHWTFACMLLKRPKRIELCPMAKINPHVRPPVLMLGEEAVFRSDNFSFEIGC